MEETYIIGENKDTAIYIIGKHKDTAIYMIAENGKRTYMHGLNVFEFFNTLDETLYDIDEILTYKNLCERGFGNETRRV